MDRAAKLARMGDRLISFIAMILVLCMMLYGGYSLWTTGACRRQALVPI